MQNNWSGSGKEKFVNPYNFVRLPSRPCVRKNRNEENEKHNLSGVMHCTLTVETPLFIPSADDTKSVPSSDGRGEHLDKEFFSYGDPAKTPVIPGSELRGVIRSTYETLTDSCLSGATDNIFTKREPAPNEGSKAMNPGILEYDETQQRWLLYAADMYDSLSPANPANPDEALVYFTKKQVRTAKRTFDQAVFTSNPSGALKGYYKQGNKFSGNGGRTHVFVKKANSPASVVSDKDIRGYAAVLEQYGDQKSNKDPQHNGYQQEAKYLKNHKTHGVFYREVGQGRDASVYLSPARIGRIGLHRTVFDLLKKSTYVPCSEGVKDDMLCPACQLFGTIYKDNGDGTTKASTSHVRFTDAKLTKDMKKEPKVTLHVLAVPHYSNELMYLSRRHQSQTEFNPDFELIRGFANGRRDIRYNQLSEGEVTLNGRKFYWHQPNFVLPKSEEKGIMNSTIHPLKKGNEFEFDIYFDRISEEELNALAFATDLGDDGMHFQKVGYAKPLGFGSSKVSVTSIELKKLSAEPDQPLYQMVPFTNRVKDYRSIWLIDNQSAEQLLTITDFNFLKHETISYPFTNGHRGTDNGFEWFTENKRLENRISMPVIGKDPSSVTMEALNYSKSRGGSSNRGGGQNQNRSFQGNRNRSDDRHAHHDNRNGGNRNYGGGQRQGGGKHQDWNKNRGKGNGGYDPNKPYNPWEN